MSQRHTAQIKLSERELQTLIPLPDGCSIVRVTASPAGAPEVFIEVWHSALPPVWESSEAPIYSPEQLRRAVEDVPF